MSLPTPYRITPAKRVAPYCWQRLAATTVAELAVLLLCIWFAVSFFSVWVADRTQKCANVEINRR